MQSAFEFLQTRKRKPLKSIKRRRVYKAKLLRPNRKRESGRTTYRCDTWAHEYGTRAGFTVSEVYHLITGEVVGVGDAYDMRNLCLELNG